MKLLINVVVIILNYIFSKLIVFKKDGGGQEMCIKKKYLTVASIVYLYAGVFCFILGWLTWLIAIICSVFTTIAIAIFFKDILKDEEVYYINRSTLFIILGFFLVACLICGHGAFVAQTYDWEKHNAILHDLVFKSWPVVYSTETESAMLSYYIGHYLPSALVGKIFGSFRVAEIALLFWNVVGLFLAYVNIAAVQNIRTLKKHIFVLLNFALFSGMFALIQLVLGRVGITFFSSYKLLMPSNASQLRYAFPQMIPTWIVTSLLYREPKKIENYCVLGVPLMISSTIPFGGLVILMLILALANFDYKNFSKELLPYLKRIFSLQNILVIIGCASVLMIYVFSNVGQAKPDGAGFSTMDWTSTYWVCYFVFELTNVLFVFVPLYCINRKASKIDWASIITLLIIPLFTMGTANDWCMRAGIAAYFVLMIYTVETVSNVFETNNVLPWKKILSGVVCCGILLGSVYTLGGIVRQIVNYGITVDGSARYGEIVSLDEWCNRDGSINVDKAYNYFIYDYEDSLFYKTISRKVD